MKVAVIFNGQGAHYEDMGLDFVGEFKEAKDVFELAEAQTSYPLRKWIANEPDRFKETRYAQPAIAAVSLAIFRSIASKLPAIEYMAGLSLGEYSALMASGMLSLEDGFVLLTKRGEIMSQVCAYLEVTNPAQMVAVMKMPYEEIEAIVSMIHDIKSPLYIANINSSQQVTLAGSKESIEAFKSIAKEKGYKKIMPLKVEGPFHSPLMKDVCDPFVEVLEFMNFSSSEIDVISNTTLQAHTPEFVKDTLVNHLISPVHWKETIDLFIENHVTHVIQIGPGKTLVNLMKRENSTPPCLVIDSVEDTYQIEDFLNKGEL